MAPFKGNIKVNEDLSEVTYHCDNGYIIRFGGEEYRSLDRKCLKHGQWEGYDTPICISKFRFLRDCVTTTREEGRCPLIRIDLI